MSCRTTQDRSIVRVAGATITSFNLGLHIGLGTAPRSRTSTSVSALPRGASTTRNSASACRYRKSPDQPGQHRACHGSVRAHTDRPRLLLRPLHVGRRRRADVCSEARPLCVREGAWIPTSTGSIVRTTRTARPSRTSKHSFGRSATAPLTSECPPTSRAASRWAGWNNPRADERSRPRGASALGMVELVRKCGVSERVGHETFPDKNCGAQARPRLMLAGNRLVRPDTRHLGTPNARALPGCRTHSTGAGGACQLGATGSRSQRELR